jgi:Condensation domain
MPSEARELRSARNDAAGFLRPLGSAEHFFHLYAQVYPVHFCLCAEIEGAVDADALRSALNHVRERHPVLRARIVDDESLGTAFHESDQPIELKTIYAGRGVDWRLTVERELLKPMGIGRNALLRATALRTPEVAFVILTFHHVIADGLSAVWILHDMMRALSGEKLEAFKSFSPIEEKLLGSSLHRDRGNKPDQDTPFSPQSRPVAALLPANLQTHLDTAEFSKDETALLIARCRSNGTTVHSAICAAAAHHVPASDEDVVRITSPFDMRKAAEIDVGVCGIFLGVGSADVRIEQYASIWDDARRIGDSMAKARSLDVATEFIRQMSAEFLPTVGPEKFLEFFASRPQTALVVSNLGILPLAEQYGTYAVNAVWGPAMLTNYPADRQTIGVCTFGGRLRIVHQSYVPIRGLAAAIRHTLLAACDGGA